MRLIIVLLVAALAAGAYCNCGCLKCSKHLRVVSGPSSPIKVIYNGQSCNCPKSIGYNVEVPVVDPQPEYQRQTFDYQVQALRQPQNYALSTYQYGVEAPVEEQAAAPQLYYGLQAKPDRVVLPAPDHCFPEPPCGNGPIFENINSYRHPLCRRYVFYPNKNSCGARNKRSLLVNAALLKARAFGNLLKMKTAHRKAMLSVLQPKPKNYFPSKPFDQKYLLKSPRLDTFSNKQAKSNPNLKNIQMKSRSQSEAKNTESKRKVLRKASKKVSKNDEKLPPDVQFYNNIKIEPVFPKSRKPRAVHLRTTQDTPFYVLREQEDEDQEIVGQQAMQSILMHPLNFEQMIPHEPIFYWLNTPIRLLKHVQNLKQQIQPVVKSVPEVMRSSNKHLTTFGKNLQTEAVNIGNGFVKLFYELNPFRGLAKFTKKVNKRDVGGESNFVLEENSVAISDDVNPSIVLENNYEFSISLPEDKEETKIGDNEADQRIDLLQQQLQEIKHTFSKEEEEEEEQQNIFASRPSSKETLKPYEPEYSLVFQDAEPANTNHIRTKRTLLKVIDESELKAFLKEKLPECAESAEKEDENDEVIQAVVPKSVVENYNQKTSSSKKRFIIEKVKPNVIIDDNGVTYLEINEKKQEIKSKKKDEEIVQESNSLASLVGKLIPQPPNVEDHNVKDTIVQLINKAKGISDKPVAQTANFDRAKYVKIIMDKITSTLPEIENLVHADFEKEFDLFEDLLTLHLMKNSIVKDWKIMLINERANDMKEKIRLLNSIHEAQKLKETVVYDITEKFHTSDYHNKRKLIVMLLNVQRLQLIFLKIVEDFSNKISTNTSFDIQKEIKYVESIEAINIVSTTRRDHLEKRLKDDRDEELKRLMVFLQELREILDKESEVEDKKIVELGKAVWEINNLEKLQRDSFKELNSKLKFNLKVRREMKIIFDLQKQLENCEVKQQGLIDDILEKNKIIQKEADVDKDSKGLKLSKLNLFLKKPNLLMLKNRKLRPERH